MAKGITAPYGDIVYVSTPATDRWGQQLYAEQKTREMRMQQENAALDANIQKELGRVRSIDTPEVIKAYQDYKGIKQEMMFNDKLRKDPYAYNKAKQMANAAYQKIFTTANESEEAKTLAKNMFQGRMKNPNDYHDQAGQMIGALTNTPLSQLRSHPQFGDLTNPDNYMDMGMNTNWGKLIDEGAGSTATEKYSEKTPMEGGLQTQITPYMFKNTPLQVKDYLIGSMGMRQAGKDAVKAWDKTPESEIENTIKQYQALPKEYWQQMGLQGPQDLLPKNPDSKAENWASYQAMKYAIANKPTPGKPQIVQNLKAIEDLKFDRAKQMEAIKQGNREDLIRLKKQINPSDTELNNVWYQGYLDRLTKDAKETGEKRHAYLSKSGKSLFYYDVIKPDAFTMKAFAREGVEPDKIGVTEGGDIVPIFYNYVKDANGNASIEKLKGTQTPVINNQLSQPMSYEQALVNLGYRGSTKKQLDKQMQNLKPQPKEQNVDINELRKKYKYHD